MSNFYAYKHCQPQYHACVDESLKAKAETEAEQPKMYYPNPFAPHGGAKAFCSNDLLLHDLDMRRRALIKPLDCGITDMIRLNPEPQL